MAKAVVEVIKGIAYGTIGGLIAMASATLYIRRLDRKLIASIEATMDAVDEIECTQGPEYPGRKTSFVVAIPPGNGGEVH